MFSVLDSLQPLTVVSSSYHTQFIGEQWCHEGALSSARGRYRHGIFVFGVRELSGSATKRLVLAALFLALGLLMPCLTGQIPTLGSKLVPMHLPVLICGFVCGWPTGLVVGLITPVFRSLIFGMPPLFPTAVVMSFELAAYGFATGWFRRLFPKTGVFVYLTLICPCCSAGLFGA